MKQFSRYLYKIYLDIVNSIAFYPTLLSIGFLLFSFLIMSIEYKQFVMDFKDHIEIVLVEGEDNARLILCTLVGSIISLMVFSFSMVMLVLSRASTALSPRVIPGLITKKSHQVVLGVYLGTIIYSLILIINIQSHSTRYHVPSLGVFFSMAFGISCLAWFVYFIHSISKSIQVDDILDSIFSETSMLMDQCDQRDVEDIPDTTDWKIIESNISGYLKRINISQLKSICEKHDMQVALMVQVGFFLIEGYPFIKVSKPIDEEQKNVLIQCFICYAEEHINDHYLFGFKQISEIGVKALSPGINDPGTAIKVLDMLSILFIKKMNLNESKCIKDNSGKIRLIFKELSLEELLYKNLTPIREYGKADAVVMLNVLESLKNLIYADNKNKKYEEVLMKYVKSMVGSCQLHIDNDLDKEQLNHMIAAINQYEGKVKIDCLE